MEEKEFEVPVEGSLGLLAFGHIGLKLWREKRMEEKNKKRERDLKTKEKQQENKKEEDVG